MESVGTERLKRGISEDAKGDILREKIKSISRTPDTKTVIIIIAKVRNMFQTGLGNWYVQFDGSWESLNFGQEKPDFCIGDSVKITFEKEPTCPPSPNTNPTNSPNFCSSATAEPVKQEP